MAKVKIGDQIIKIGDDDYTPSKGEIQQVADKLGITAEQTNQPKPIQLPDESERQAKFDGLVKTAKNIGGKALLQKTGVDIGFDAVQGKLFDDDPLALASTEFALGALDTASFGIPRKFIEMATEKAGIKVPESTNRAATTAGKIAGFLVPGKIGLSLANRIGLSGRGVAKGMAQGAISAGFVGFTEAPDDFLDLEQRTKQALGASALGVVGVPIARGIQNLARVGPKAVQFAHKVRRSLFESKRNLGKSFEKALDAIETQNPNTIINLEDEFIALKNSAKGNSRIINDLRLAAKRVGLLREDKKSIIDGFLKNPESASKVSLSQSRDIKRIVNEVSSIKSNLKKPPLMRNFAETDIDLIDFVDDVKGKQLSAFPELASANQAYSEGIKKYNLIKGRFKEGQLIDNMTKGFGDAELRQTVSSLLPKQIIQEMGGFRAAAKFLNVSKWLAIVGVGGAVAGFAGSKILDAVGQKQ